MALNKVVYFSNPTSNETLGTSHSLSTSTTTNTTLLTVAVSGEVKKVKSFILSYDYRPGGVGDSFIIKITIGSGVYRFSSTETTNDTIGEITAAELGITDLFLQPNDTIVVTTTLVDSTTFATVETSFLVTVEEYTA